MVCARYKVTLGSRPFQQCKYIYNFVNLVKFVCKLLVRVKFPHDKFHSYFQNELTSSRQLPRNFLADLLRGSWRRRQLPRGLVMRKLATSPTSPRGSYEEVNDVTRKLRGTGPSGIWPYSGCKRAVCVCACTSYLPLHMQAFSEFCQCAKNM